MTKENLQGLKIEGTLRHSLYSVTTTNIEEWKKIAKIRGLVKRRKEAGRRRNWRMKKEEDSRRTHTTVKYPQRCWKDIKFTKNSQNDDLPRCWKAETGMKHQIYPHPTTFQDWTVGYFVRRTSSSVQTLFNTNLNKTDYTPGLKPPTRRQLPLSPLPLSPSVILI